MDLQRLERQVMEDEGYSSEPYLDTEGVWTIGYGSTRWFDGPVVPGTPPTDRPTALRLLRADLWHAAALARDLVSNWDELGTVRQEVLANMAYNLGIAGVRKFRKTLEAIEAANWSAAAEEMLDSLWASQVKGRALRLAAAMRSGSWAS